MQFIRIRNEWIAISYAGVFDRQWHNQSTHNCLCGVVTISQVGISSDGRRFGQANKPSDCLAVTQHNAEKQAGFHWHAEETV